VLKALSNWVSFFRKLNPPVSGWPPLGMNGVAISTPAVGFCATTARQEMSVSTAAYTRPVFTALNSWSWLEKF
jgi:hypothetical protein